MWHFYLAFAIGVCYCRPQEGFQSTQNTPQFNNNQFRNTNPIDDLNSGISGFANGARATAVLVEEGGGAGVDILSQFGQLFGESRNYDQSTNEFV